MGKYIKIEDTFGEIWKELEAAKERIYLIRLADKKELTMIDGISKLIYGAQEKVLNLQSKYSNYFANEIAKEEEEEA